jgi:hypothetical protein
MHVLAYLFTRLLRHLPFAMGSFLSQALRTLHTLLKVRRLGSHDDDHNKQMYD